MAQHQVGQKEAAQRTLARLREALKKPPWSQSPQAAALLREAEALLEAAPAPKK